MVIFRQNTQVIALLFGQKSLIFITFQSAIKLNQFHLCSCFAKILRLLPYHLDKSRSFLSLFNLLSNSMNFTCGHFPAKYTGYSFTFWPEITYFHHFSICNQTQSISIVVIFWQNTRVIALLSSQHRSFSSLVNVQSKSMNFNCGDFVAKYQGYSLTF